MTDMIDLHLDVDMCKYSVFDNPLWLPVMFEQIIVNAKRSISANTNLLNMQLEYYLLDIYYLFYLLTILVELAKLIKSKFLRQTG